MGARVFEGARAPGRGARPPGGVSWPVAQAEAEATALRAREDRTCWFPISGSTDP